MMQDLRCRGVLCLAAALLVSSCEGGAKPTTPVPVTPAAKADEKKPVEPAKADVKPEIKAEAAPAAKSESKPEEKKAAEPLKPAQPASTTPTSAAAPNPALRNPALANEKAPDKFKAKFSTTKGDFVIEVTREWAPNGADRFYNMLKIGYFSDLAFFRNIAGFMVQFGISGDPAVNSKWSSSNIKDDPVTQSNKPGYVTFAQTSFPNSRSTQIFINFGDNKRLDGQRFAPFGRVIEGMNVVESLYNGYGEGGLDQGRIQAEGNAYLKKDFPNLDYVKSAVITN